MWRGTAELEVDLVDLAGMALNFHDFGFFCLEEVVDLGLEIFHEVVDGFLGAVGVVFWEFGFFDVF